MTAPAPGTVLVDRFVLEREAGAGGMGRVWRALDRRSGAHVALKLMLVPDSSEALRFEREATLLAQIDDPRVVRHVAHGVGPGGAPYLAMEWLEGVDLAARLAQGPLEIGAAVAVAIEVASALAVVHGLGLVHRDVKPSNVFLVGGRLDEVRLVDFGIARRCTDATSLTATGRTIGTPAYMAPEQVRGERTIDARTDVFALGALLFECIAGRPPFWGDSVFEVLTRILLEPAPPLGERVSHVPREIERLVARMLDKERTARPADGAAVVRLLDALAPAPASRVPSGDPAQGPAIGASEQRVMCFLAVGGPIEADVNPLDATTPSHRQRLPFDAIRAEALAAGARFERLVDGSAIAILGGGGVASDLAHRAALLALAARALAPDVPLALATGRAETGGPLPVGDVVRRAAALLDVGCSGAARLDDLTARLVAPRFLVERDPTTGSSILVGVREAEESSVRRVLGRATSCVGRERELATLEALFAESVEEGEARLAVVTGPPGAGKTRLRAELSTRLIVDGEPARILSAQADAEGARSPFGLVATILRREAGVAPGESAEARHGKLARMLTRDLEGAAAAHALEFLGELAAPVTGAAPSEALRAARRDRRLLGDAMREAWHAWLAALARRAPLVILLEDLHWGDLPSVDFVGSALKVLERAPLFVAAFARPDVHEVFPDLWASRSPHPIPLAGLSRKASERLVDEVLGRDVDAAVRAFIVGRAAGNPFYLEELMRAAASRGDASPSGQPLDVPDSVLGMVQCRLDALGPDLRRVLRAASVFGETFWRGGLGHLLGGDPAVDLGRALDDLRVRELIEPRAEGRFPDEEQFVFRHALVRDVAYAMLPDRDRDEAHGVAGAWLERSGEVDPTVLGGHLERSREPRRAIPFFLHAAEDALDGSDLEMAFARADRAIGLGADGAVLGAARLVQARARSWQGALAEALALAEQAAGLLARDDPAWFHAVGEAVACSARIGDAGRLLRWTDDLIATPDLATARQAQIVSLCRTMVPLTNVGSFDAAERVLRRLEAAAGEAAALGPYATAQMAEARGIFLGLRGELGPFVEFLGSAVRGYEQAGAMRDAATALGSLAWGLLHVGQADAAAESVDRALQLAERLALTHVRTWAMFQSARVAALRGQRSEACARMGDVADVYAAQGSRRQEGMARAELARMLGDAGDPVGAEAQAERACELLEHAPALRPLSSAVHALALAALGRASEARARAEEASEIERALGTFLHGGTVDLALVAALVASGETDAAGTESEAGRGRLLARAARLPVGLAASFLALPDHTRLLGFAAGTPE